ncbi:hypothetical protein, partial [Niallia circulans]|uniref:hypothetical protein n=1 Tax=Niallia circulans TaxID=1397 RepID=UPI002E1D6EEB|nr:hypothetical protein [Niallia circulans]MED4250429.1 hypothetical protein [Niallia circulans]
QFSKSNFIVVIGDFLILPEAIFDVNTFFIFFFVSSSLISATNINIPPFNSLCNYFLKEKIFLLFFCVFSLYSDNIIRDK